MSQQPTIGRVVLYRTDGRNGLTYDLPAIVTCTAGTHPGAYPDGSRNPLPVPGEGEVHLTVFTPGGFGTTVKGVDGEPFDDDYIGATELVPGSGTYVELSVPHAVGADGVPADVEQEARDRVPPRSWRWPFA